MEIDGTLYLGYPVLSTADSKVFVDALLVSSTHGLVAFDLTSSLPPHPDDEERDALTEKQDQIHASLFNKLNAHRDLRKGRSLGFDIYVVTYHPTLADVIHEDELIATPPVALPGILADFAGVDHTLLRPLNAAIQRVSTLRPPKRRDNVVKSNSRGAILKKIEKEIANLDQWQNRGAIEYANGPQRIRGLAGSGKTVVLALKAAYLAARHPEWKIAVTFQSRSLYQQFRDLIRRFMFDQIEDEPNWENVQVLHGWGSPREMGLYSTACAAYGVSPLDWRTADQRYGSRAYEGICDELNAVIEKEGSRHLFDAVLIDEAQDFPTSFFRMIYNIVPAPHRIMWAYDDLQNLGDYEMRSEHDLFGRDSDGQPLVSLRNDTDKPKEDIVLPVCYRNTPWTLATAHALGFGLYRPEGLVQMFEEPSIWPRIGYELVGGQLQLGAPVALRRSPESYPSYFGELLNPDDAIICRVFNSTDDQYAELARCVKENITEDELDPTDILIVLPSAYTSKKHGAAIMAALSKEKILAHLAGVTTSRDQIFSPNSVAITHIFRAKGNEAPMVYIVNAEFCQVGFELSRKRNILFTGITRSRCWVRLFGVGQYMVNLKAEVDEVRRHAFELRFTYPTEEQLKQLARVHRDMTDDEKKDWERKFASAGDVFRAVLDGEIPLEALPTDLQKVLLEISKKSKRSK
jgi:superfamily I DNA and RNA helicase